jgi:hypothetical protein
MYVAMLRDVARSTDDASWTVEAAEVVELEELEEGCRESDMDRVGRGSVEAITGTGTTVMSSSLSSLPLSQFPSLLFPSLSPSLSRSSSISDS